uniref:endolytic transglycosylase MltG n=1 Tax=uncultured Actinomyces sp. TaxID=249061 RepID=UPI0026157791
MSDQFPRPGGDNEPEKFPSRRDILRERQLRAAEEARKEDRRRAREQRRLAEEGAPTSQSFSALGQRPVHTAQQAPDENPHHDPLTTGTRSRRVAAERARVLKRRRNAKIRTGLIITVVIAVIALCVYIALGAISSSRSQTGALDYPGPGTGEVEVVVNPGDSGGAIGANLVKLGVVKSEDAFLQAWLDNAAANSLQPGTYILKKEMRAVDALAALLDPSNRSSNAITVPPGFTKAQVIERLSSFGNFSAEEVEAAMLDVAGIGLPAEADGNAEGWLAPGTYEVHSDDKPQDVIGEMVTAMKTKLDGLGV